MDSLTAGFIGLGDMGLPIARRIVASGFPTTLWARREASLAGFEPSGFTRAHNPADLGARSRVVGICVFSDADVRDVLLGPQGVLAGMRPGGIVLIHSTVTARVCEDVAVAAAAHDIAILDAPVSGGSASAVAGTLTVMVGGDVEAMERARPVLESFARVIRHMGPLGSGQRMKALNNVTGFGNGRIASIAIEIGVALGLDGHAVMDVLRSGGAGSYAIDSIATALLPDPAFQAHAATMIEKDTRLFQLYREAAELPRSVLDQLAEERIARIVPALGK
jgi:3-hydroxyisobutyrate dehydrogenase